MLTNHVKGHFWREEDLGGQIKTSEVNSPALAMAQFIDKEAFEIGRSRSSDEDTSDSSSTESELRIPRKNQRSIITTNDGDSASESDVGARRVKRSKKTKKSRKRSHSPGDDRQSARVLVAVEKTASLVANLTKRLKETEKKLESIEKNMMNESSLSSSASTNTDQFSTPKRARAKLVPIEVRVS